MHTQLANAIIMPVYWYFHFHFQQNIALFCAISDFVLLLLFANASCLIQWQVARRDTGREVTAGGGSGEHLNLPPARSGPEIQPKTMFGHNIRHCVRF